MKRLLIASLPPLSALVVVAGAAYFLVSEDDGSPRAGAPASTTSSEGATPGALRLAPESNVCQGILHVPDAGSERAFPAEYTQRREASGFVIVANERVDPKALDEAARTVDRVFARNDLERDLVAEGAYVIVADRGQGVLDLPEFRCLGESERNQDFFSHVCGVADRADYPVVTVNELDLLGSRQGPCNGLNILYHELGHLVQGWTLGPADYFDVRQFFQDAISAGKYRKDYAATNANEYFAEATQAYFHFGDAAKTRDRAWLREYDPQILALLSAVYGD